MDWTLAITHNREALLRLVAMLFAASGLVPGQAARLPKIIRGAVLHVLRPAESAARRLVVIEAHVRGLVVAPRAPRAAPTQPIPRGKGERVPAFALFDPRKRFETGAAPKYAKLGPRMFFFDGSDPAIEPVVETPIVSPDDPVDAARLLRRMEALKAALEDLPKQARRLARMQARREKTAKDLVRPLRPGRPPGHRARRVHEVDGILQECHALALEADSARRRPP